MPKIVSVGNTFAKRFPKPYRAALVPCKVVEKSSVENRPGGGVIYSVVHGTITSENVPGRYYVRKISHYLVVACARIQDIFPGLDLYYTGPAQHLTAAG